MARMLEIIIWMEIETTDQFLELNFKKIISGLEIIRILAQFQHCTNNLLHKIEDHDSYSCNVVTHISFTYINLCIYIV